MIDFTKPRGRTELANALGVSRQALWLWQQAGDLPAPTVPVGRRLKFSVEAQMVATMLAARAGA